MFAASLVTHFNREISGAVPFPEKRGFHLATRPQKKGVRFSLGGGAIGSAIPLGPYHHSYRIQTRIRREMTVKKGHAALLVVIFLAVAVVGASGQVRESLSAASAKWINAETW